MQYPGRLIILLTFGILSLIVSLSGCASDVNVRDSAEIVNATPSPANTAVPEGYLSYTNTDAGISFTYPKSWTMIENYMNSKVIFIKGDNSSVNLIIQNVSAISDRPLTPGEINEIMVTGLKELMYNLTITRQEAINFKGCDGYRIEYSGKPKMISVDDRWEQIWFVKGNNLYVLTYTALPENYDVDAREANSIMDSLTVIEVISSSLPATITASGDHMSYIDREAGVSFMYPKSWSVSEDYLGSTAVFIKEDGSNVVLKIKEISASANNDATLQELADVYGDIVKQSFSDVSIGSQELITFKGIDAYRIKYNVTIDGLKEMTEQIVFLKGDKMYIFTSTVLPKNYDESGPEIMYILDSFEII